jgi:hypothetical protein
MMADINSSFGCQMSYKKAPIVIMSLHLFVYQMSKLCKLFTQYTSCKAVNIAKSGTRK